MKVLENAPLKSFNTFWINVTAKYLITIDSESDIIEVVKDDRYHNLSKFILGGGSNTLFTDDYEGIVLRNRIMGKHVFEETDREVVLSIGAGEDWHEFVTYAVENGWSGIENLALIPGTVGGAPVQNIAAYGENFEDVFHSLDYIDLSTGEKITFNKEDCKFGYRDSIFKNELKGKAFVTNVRIRLSKEGTLETSYFSIGRRYDSVQSELEAIAKEPYSIKDVYQAVINIRSRKLLDPKDAPTVGSFFINPIITRQKYEELLKVDPEMQAYPIDQLTYVKMDNPDFSQDEYVKIPVGRLLDISGWIGKKIGNCMVHDQWASIITHNGNATGQEMLAFISTIQKDIQGRYGIDLKSEVSIV
ncbi:UDP-N-acetylmuramate dehydrogenase [candidate division WWE3 bacterium]|uniref:UDP-N-acetylenolpyruvoylglucosamine reductase n=1 Tax=candidate division WWE3 bacterium TaxID=2053526 RepID=A0A955LG54_UNCKA|nr:UDP-N-acetylmuramate dehydrogenase [candidate division WWE3 bacterium]